MLTPLSRPKRRKTLRLALLFCFLCGLYAANRLHVAAPHELTALDRLIIRLSAPVQDLLTRVYSKGETVVETLTALSRAVEENRENRKHIRVLEARLNELAEVRQENKRLRRLLGFRRIHPGPFRAARVIAYDPITRYRTLRVDRGELEGIEKDMAVCTDQGIVGRVFQVWRHHADVLLISDPQSGVDALVERTRARGTVEGEGGRMLRMKYLLRMDEVQKGGVVVTSGFDGVFPRGLRIGTIEGLQRHMSGVFQEVRIQPAVDLYELEEVLILAAPPKPSRDVFGPDPRPEARK